MAKLTGAAQRHANWHELSETAAGVAKLQEIIGGRPDGASLLAELAGIFIGAREGDLDESGAMGAAELCIAAGAGKTDHAVDRGRAPTKGDRQQAAVPRHCRTGDPRTGRLGRMTLARTAYLQWSLSVPHRSEWWFRGWP